MKIFKIATVGPSYISEQNDFSNSEFPCHSDASHRLGSIRIREGCQDGHSHLGYRNETFLAILNLYVAPMHPIKFQLNSTRFGRRYRLKIYKMADTEAILDIGTE